MPAKILIVEDNADARDLLEMLLSRHGFTAIVAEDGLAGLRLVETERPDLIITDIEMPNLDGVGFIKKLREHPLWKRIPILVVSAYESGDLTEAMLAGADATLRKPIRLTSLINLINRLMPSI